MEKVLEKISIYDIVGYLLPGMSAILIWQGLNVQILSKWMDVGIFRENADEGSLYVIFFFIGSYLLGLFLHEIGSTLDRLFRWGYKPKESFLLDLRIGDTARWNMWTKYEDDLKDARAVGEMILGHGRRFVKSDCSYVFEKCRNRLEFEGKDGKFVMMDSMFALSRSLMTTLTLLSAIYAIEILYETLGCHNEVFPLLLKLILLLLGVLFFSLRTKRFARYRINALISGYQLLIEKEQSGRETALRD